MFLLRICKLLVLATILGVLAIAIPAFGQTGGLTGKALLQDGTPCVKCPVLIERQEVKGNYPTKTNKKGEYVYVGLPIGNYKITLQDPNGKVLFYITHHVGLGDPTEVNFELAKEMAAVKKEQQASPEYQKQAQEQQKEQKQFAGLKGTFDQGQQLFNDKKYAEAAAVFEQAIPLAKDKNLPVVLQRAADSWDKAAGGATGDAKAQDYQKAIDYYQKAIAAKDDAAYHNGLGNVYAEMGKTAEAQAEFQKSAQLDPASASRAYFNLGAIMYNSGKMDEAADAFKKATEVDPKFADAYFMQGRALMGKLSMTPDGKVVAAPGTTEALEAYLKLDPSGKYAADAQGMLQTIQGTIQTKVKVEKKKKG